MKRLHYWEVKGDDGRPVTFSRDEWKKLYAAFWRMAGSDTYRVSPHGVNNDRQTFFISRVDDKMFTIAEREGLFWFFTGVMAAHQIRSEVVAK